MIRVLEARFVTTAVEPKGYPMGTMPEVAFVGRSNVGKSSMINTLTARKKLVRVSNTPGRTRTLNFFEVDLGLGRRETRETIRLADLPGYGFAKVAKTEKAGWELMITRYLNERAPLKVVVSIVDAEVGATPDDMRMLGFLQEAPPQILVAATKLDRLPKAKRKPALHKMADDLGVPREAVLGFSSTEKFGLEELWASLVNVLLPRES